MNETAMKSPLPSLNGLRAFEAAARHLSFAKAAEELNVTPAAISQQVRHLEDQLGIELFWRTTRSLRLTDHAKSVKPLLRDAFDLLHQVAEELQNRDQDIRTITVSVTPSFGSRWLLPRLEKFQADNPEYTVRLDATYDFADFRRHRVDVAIRHGFGEYEGLTSELLVRDAAFVVCAPQLAKSLGPFSSPRDLASKNLLHVDWQTQGEFAPSWSRWVAYHGTEDFEFSYGPRFSMEDMAVRAAIAGMGLALVTRSSVEDDLIAGRLVRALPSDYDMPTDYHHFIVYPPLRSGKPKKVAIFRDWLLATNCR